MSYELFIDVTEEQQEIVAGGSLVLAYPTNILHSNYADYSQNIKAVQFGSKSVAGPNGASSMNMLTAVDTKISSSAGDFLKFKW